RRKFLGGHCSTTDSSGPGVKPPRFFRAVPMYRSYHTLRSAGLLVLALLVCPLWAGAADAAGVVGFRNDTNQVISVQTTLELPNGVVKRGKPQMLYPGEVAIDGLIGSGTRR